MKTPLKLAYGTDRQHFGILYLPDGTGPHPVVILIHGGFWRIPYDCNLMRGLAENLARRGFAAWNIEYRRLGDPGGGWPGTLQDVASATDHLRTIASTHDLDLHRVVPVGHSAGGHLAFWLAARSKIGSNNPLTTKDPLPLTGTISLAGAVDLKHVWRLHLSHDAAAELLGGAPFEVPERYAVASPAALLPLGVPQVLIHGTEDVNVPLIVSQKYHEKARGAGDAVTLIELRDAEHFIVIDAKSEAWEMTVQQIRRLLAVQ